MLIKPLGIPDVLLIEPKRHGDERGFFSETYRASLLAEFGFDRLFVQDNHARTTGRGILRGMHFQRPPHAQDKLVKVVAGAIFDVVVDIRRGSPTYGRWAGTELSAENGRQILVPRGFAHGYLTLSEVCDVLYKASDYYAPETEGGLKWDDPTVNIEWPLPIGEIRLNARDAAWPDLQALAPADWAAQSAT